MPHLVALWAYLSLHFLGVLGAVLASVVVGFLWHGVLFNAQWARLTKLDHLTDAQKKEAMPAGLAASIAMAFLQAVVLGRTFQLLSLGSIVDAFLIAVVIWLPFVGLSMLNNYVWERRPFALFLIDAGYNLASLLAITAVLYVTL